MKNAAKMLSTVINIDKCDNLPSAQMKIVLLYGFNLPMHLCL